VVHSDSGSVFLSKEYKKCCLEMGIKQDVSAPYSHQHNLVEGSCIRVILNRARVLLADAGLPVRFSEYAVQEAIRTWNMMPHPMLAVMSPVERVTSEKPDLSASRAFGSVGYYFATKQERALAADPRWKETALKGIILGMAPGLKGAYLIYPGRNRKVIVRKQVVVMEAKETELLPFYSDRYQIGDPMTESETIQQEDKRVADAEEREPVASRTRGANRGEASIGSRRAAVEAACVAAGDDSEYAMAAGEEEDEGASEGILRGRQMPKTPRSIAEALASEHRVDWKIALDRELADCLSGDSYVGVDEKPLRFMNSVMSFRVSVKADGSLKFRVRCAPTAASR
jgi:hypothetical protein